MRDLRKKIRNVKENLSPLFHYFDISDWDYIQEENNEFLVIEGQKIGCSFNSVDDIINEAIIYIFIRRKIYLGTFDTQSKNHMRRYWVKK